MAIDDKLVARVKDTLSSSDIVWSKYGGDTIEELAIRLVTICQESD
jgi:hypothetical protein